MSYKVSYPVNAKQLAVTSEFEISILAPTCLIRSRSGLQVSDSHIDGHKLCIVRAGYVASKTTPTSATSPMSEPNATIGRYRQQRWRIDKEVSSQREMAWQYHNNVSPRASQLPSRVALRKNVERGQV